LRQSIAAILIVHSDSTALFVKFSVIVLLNRTTIRLPEFTSKCETGAIAHLKLKSAYADANGYFMNELINFR